MATPNHVQPQEMQTLTVDGQLLQEFLANPDPGEVVAVWGGAGNGKSTLANRLLGLTYSLDGGIINSNEKFIASGGAGTCTEAPLAKRGFWFRDQAYGKLTVIDTPGFGDPAGPAQDVINITESIKTLQRVQPGVSLFVLVVNGHQSRMDKQLHELIILFQTIFTPEVWNHVALCFTHWSIDSRSLRGRHKGSMGEPGTPATDRLYQQRAETEFFELIEKTVGYKLPKIPFFFVDSEPDISDDKPILDEMASQFLRIWEVAKTKSHFSTVEREMATRVQIRKGFPFVPSESPLSIENGCSFPITKVLYRIVHIHNSIIGKVLGGILSLGISLAFVREDIKDKGKFEKWSNYIASQDFEITEIKQNETFLSSQKLQFEPYYSSSRGFNHYHFISAEFRDGKKETKGNWMVRLYEEDIRNQVKIIIYESRVNIALASGSASSKFD